VDEALWAPIAVIAGELAQPPDVNPEVLTSACLAVTDWALGCDADGTALLFAEAAAVVWPNNARLAWLCGKMYRERQQFGRAEMWLRRARRVAVWTGDWELQAQAVNSLGNLKVRLGDLAGGRELLLSAARLAKRKRLRERLAMAHHDLFVVATYAGQFSEAESHAQQAFAAYDPDHPNLLRLAFDVAHWWTQQGQFSRALQVLKVLRGRFADPECQLQVLASTARAAGALNNSSSFHDAWAQAWKLIDSGVADRLRAAAALELGLGALNLDLREHAEHALNIARDAARELREGDTLARAESALDHLARHTLHHVVRQKQTILQPTDLATRLARSVDAQVHVAKAGEN
jgi:tetratricopeptide (TPR) repeat protein